MTTATASPNLDLGREIERHQAAAKDLTEVQSQIAIAQQRLAQHGLTLTLTPASGNGAAAVKIRAIDAGTAPAVKSGKTTGAILHEWLLKHKGQTLTVNEAMEIAKEGGVTSKSANFYGVILSALRQDTRFKKRKTRGAREVRWGLNNNV